MDSELVVREPTGGSGILIRVLSFLEEKTRYTAEKAQSIQGREHLPKTAMIEPPQVSMMATSNPATGHYGISYANRSRRVLVELVPLELVLFVVTPGKYWFVESSDDVPTPALTFACRFGMRQTLISPPSYRRT